MDVIQVDICNAHAHEKKTLYIKVHTTTTQNDDGRTTDDDGDDGDAKVFDIRANASGNAPERG